MGEQWTQDSKEQNIFTWIYMLWTLKSLLLSVCHIEIVREYARILQKGVLIIVEGTKYSFKCNIHYI